MTQEQKAKAYDEAVEQAEKEILTCGSLNCDTARLIFRLFPQFNKSEDERIRKFIYDYIANSYWMKDWNVSQEECLAYLEKQKEISESDAYALLSKKGYVVLERSAYNELCEETEKNHQGFAPDELQKSFEEGQKSIVGNPEKYGLCKVAEWSEEDEKNLDCIINVLDRLGFEEFCKSSRDQDNEEERFYYKEIQFLKRLKSIRPSWKPSERQLTKLYCIAEGIPDNNDARVLKELYEQLRKL